MDKTMECPSCNRTTNTNDVVNKYFLGRNSNGIPFFKCEECGNLFYINEKEGIAHPISRGERVSRLVPVIWGVLCWIIAIGIVWFLGSNIVTWFFIGTFLWLGWFGIKIGIWGTQKLIDELTLDKGVELSKEAAQEWNKFRGK
jgi:hypothetical protein